MKFLLIPLIIALAVLTSLSQTEQVERYESVVQIVHRDAADTNDKGEIETVDIELEWDPCPGDQFQVVRGGKEFAACTAKYDVGEYIDVKVVHFWDPHGFYRWDIEQLGDCKRAIEPASEGSYEKSQECEEYKSYGKTSGFACSRLPKKNLTKICPWLARQ